jgi:hypothetical protein
MMRWHERKRRRRRRRRREVNFLQFCRGRIFLAYLESKAAM